MKIQTTKILCIGNSFSEDATALLNPMLTSYGIDTIVVNLFIGGCSLQQHWENIQHAKQDYLYMKNGVGISPGNPSGRMVSINEMILEEDWDIVVIQQSSILSGKEDSFFPEIELILEFIKKHVKTTSKLYLHEPWSWESTFKWESKFEGENLFKLYYENKDDVMCRKIKDTYSSMSQQLNLKIIPSGDLIQYLRSFPDFDNLNKQWISLSRDGLHMHEIFGRFALSLLWAHTLFAIDVRKCQFYPYSISEKDKAIIDKIRDLCDQFVQNGNSVFQKVNCPISGQLIWESKVHKLQVAMIDIGKIPWQNALEACENLGNGWALPDTESLEIIRNELFLKGIGNIASGYYWSSVELSRRDALYMRMSDGVTHNFYFQEDYKKTNQFLVRPVRILTDDI